MIRILFWKVKELIKFYFSAIKYIKIENENLRSTVIDSIENKDFPHLELIEKKRLELQSDLTNIKHNDLGAGSRTISNKSATVKDIASNSLSPDWKCQLITNIIRKSQSEYILELGTSFGILTSYIAKHIPNCKIHTIEGDATIASLAQKNFTSLNISNIELTIGNIDDELEKVLIKSGNISFAILDGNHRKIPTLHYFKTILNFTSSDTMFFIDDIRWSKEMYEAWKELIHIPYVTASIDFYFFGVISLNPVYCGNHKILLPRFFQKLF